VDNGEGGQPKSTRGAGAQRTVDGKIDVGLGTVADGLNWAGEVGCNDLIAGVKEHGRVRGIFPNTRQQYFIHVSIPLIDTKYKKPDSIR
jgi:hypothetical protein